LDYKSNFILHESSVQVWVEIVLGCLGVKNHTLEKLVPQIFINRIRFLIVFSTWNSNCLICFTSKSLMAVGASNSNKMVICWYNNILNAQTIFYHHNHRILKLLVFLTIPNFFGFIHQVNMVIIINEGPSLKFCDSQMEVISLL
jgi:hypothetical protein